MKLTESQVELNFESLKKQFLSRLCWFIACVYSGKTNNNIIAHSLFVNLHKDSFHYEK